MKYIPIEINAAQHAKVASQYFQELFDRGYAKLAFPTEEVKVFADALNLIYDYSVDLYLIFAKPECQWEELGIKKITGRKLFQPVGSVHLTDFEGQTARAHFSAHPDFAPKKSEVLRAGKSFMEWVFLQERRDEPGVPYVSTIFGSIACYNFGARAFAKAIGFKKLAIVKAGLYSAMKKRYCDVEISMVTAGDIYEGY